MAKIETSFRDKTFLKDSLKDVSVSTGIPINTLFKWYQKRISLQNRNNSELLKKDKKTRRTCWKRLSTGGKKCFFPKTELILANEIRAHINFGKRCDHIFLSVSYFIVDIEELE